MLRLAFQISIAFALASPVTASAAPLAVQVLDSSGRPISNAVVAFHPALGAKTLRPERSYSVAQKDLEFRPFVAVVPVGATVSFPNFDPMKHHVYSFSPTKRFDLKLFAKDQSRTVRFDKPGVVPLGCNIHDSMSAFIYVAESAWTATTDARGVVRFPNATGSGRLIVWHPYMRTPGNQIVRALGSNERNIKVAVRLRPPPMHSSNGY